MNNILKLSQKTTNDELEDAPGIKPSAPPPVGVGSTKTTAPTNLTNSSIAKMQKTLIRIRNEFLRTELFNQHGTSETTGSMVDNGAFLTPLLDRNVNKNTNFQKNKSQKGDDKPWTFINRLDSIINIGSKDKRGNPVADGVWGQNTNLALIGMADIIETVYNISIKLGLPQSSEISTQEIALFKKLIPIDLTKETTQTLNYKAEEINKILISLEDKIEKFGQGITNTYVEYDKNQTGLDAGFGFGPTSAKEDVSKLPGVNTSFFSNIPQDISNPKSNQLKLSLQDLFNQETLKAFITNNNVTVDGKNPLETDDGSLINRFLDYVKNGITNKQIAIVSEENASAKTANLSSEFSSHWKQ